MWHKGSPASSVRAEESVLTLSGRFLSPIASISQLLLPIFMLDTFISVIRPHVDIGLNGKTCIKSDEVVVSQSRHQADYCTSL